MIRNVIPALILLLFSFTSSLIAQIDSLQKHGTIKVSKPKDAAYIKAYTNFYVYYNNPTTELSYRDYVLQMQEKKMKAGSSNLLKITDAKPKNDTSSYYDYTSYFMNNHFTKDIKMRLQETDTVKLLVVIDKKGVVKFMDLASSGKKGESLVIYNSRGKEYKEDVCHLKTQNAFKELINDKWQPANIKALKTHPSKRINKYKTSKGYSEGVLTVIYSSSPLD